MIQQCDSVFTIEISKTIDLKLNPNNVLKEKTESESESESEIGKGRIQITSLDLKFWLNRIYDSWSKSYD